MYFTKETEMNDDQARQGGGEEGVTQLKVTPEMVENGARRLAELVASDDMGMRVPEDIVQEVIASVFNGHLGIIFASSKS